MVSRWRRTAVIAGAAATALAVSGSLVAAGASGLSAGEKTGARAADGYAATKPVYFVHGYDPNGRKDCLEQWGNAIWYFNQRGWKPSSLETIGYYRGDTKCDVNVYDGKATKNTRIKHIAASFAKYIYKHHTSKDQSVDIVAHSMGGLITRVAMLGSAKGWKGFPKHKLKVGDIVMLNTPHRGVTHTSPKPSNAQWDSMEWGSTFMKVLHKKENRLSQSWAQSTDWTFTGADEDSTVSALSGIDKGAHADHKFRYLTGNSHPVTHGWVKKLYGYKYNLRYWHSKEGVAHDTKNGWAPLETAFNALYYNGKW